MKSKKLFGLVPELLTGSQIANLVSVVNQTISELAYRREEAKSNDHEP